MLFIPLLAVLAWPVASVGRGYCSVICGARSVLAPPSAHARFVGRLVPDARPGREWHATAAVWDQTTRAIVAQFDVDVHQTFYLPMAVFIALTLAGRWSWGGKRVVVKLLLGIVVLQLRGTLQFVDLERIVVDAPHARLSDVLLVLVNRSLVTPLSMAIAFPLLLWFGLFRRDLCSPANVTSL